MKNIILLIGGLVITSVVAANAPVPVQNEIQFTGAYVLAKNASVLPELTKSLPPSYPFEMRQSHITGKTEVAFIVDEKGRPEQVQVLNATDALFGDAAVAAVKKWRFKAGKKDGKPARIAMANTVIFQLDE